jgi:nucleotide-binding universal stress UspA family protein
LITGFKRILVAVDGSDVSFRAVEHAARLAKLEGAELLAVTVVASPQYEFPGELADYYDQARRSVARWMKDVQNTAWKLGVEAKTETVVGAFSVVDAIVGYADSKQVDLIVTGTRGKTPSSRVPMGSVANGLVAASRCPVMVVR